MWCFGPKWTRPTFGLGIFSMLTRDGGWARCYESFRFLFIVFRFCCQQFALTLLSILFSFEDVTELGFQNFATICNLKNSNVFLSVTSSFKIFDNVFTVISAWNVVFNNENCFCLPITVLERKSVEIWVRIRWRMKICYGSFAMPIQIPAITLQLW